MFFTTKGQVRDRGGRTGRGFFSERCETAENKEVEERKTVNV